MRPNPGAPRKDFFNKKFYDDMKRVKTKGMGATRARHLDPSASIINGNSLGKPYSNIIEFISVLLSPELPRTLIILAFGDFSPGSHLINSTKTFWSFVASWLPFI